MCRIETNLVSCETLRHLIKRYRSSTPDYLDLITQWRVIVFSNRNHFKQLSTYRYRLHNDNSLSSTCSSDSDSARRVTEEDHKVFGSGLKRSQAFHTAELLQQQVCLSGSTALLILYKIKLSFQKGRAS